MMSKKPDDRFQTAGEVAAQLKAWLADRGRSLGGGTIEARDPSHGSGVGSGVFTRFSLGTPTPSSGKALVRQQPHDLGFRSRHEEAR